MLLCWLCGDLETGSANLWRPLHLGRRSSRISHQEGDSRVQISLQAVRTGRWWPQHSHPVSKTTLHQSSSCVAWLTRLEETSLLRFSRHNSIHLITKYLVQFPVCIFTTADGNAHHWDHMMFYMLLQDWTPTKAGTLFVYALKDNNEQQWQQV